MAWMFGTRCPFGYPQGRPCGSVLLSSTLSGNMSSSKSLTGALKMKAPPDQQSEAPWRPMKLTVLILVVAKRVSHCVGLSHRTSNDLTNELVAIAVLDSETGSANCSNRTIA